MVASMIASMHYFLVLAKVTPGLSKITYDFKKNGVLSLRILVLIWALLAGEWTSTAAVIETKVDSRDPLN